MTDQTQTFGAIAKALAVAQAKMGKALKQANNPHFKKAYADLGNVMDACLPALNEAGIAVLQPCTDDESGRYVETVLIHGESGEILKCRVPIITQKNDMQGYGSAVTYARRYGLMTMAGIAPEDDDGNAAVKAAPLVDKEPPQPPKPSVKDRVDGAKTLADINAVLPDVTKLNSAQASEHLHSKATELGLTFDQEARAYIKI